jgi:hypothetical protein
VFSRRLRSVLSRWCVLIPLIAVELTAFTVLCLFIAEHWNRRMTDNKTPLAWLVSATEAAITDDLGETASLQQPVQVTTNTEVLIESDDQPLDSSWERTFGAYTLRASQRGKELDGLFEVVRDGQVIFSMAGHRFSIFEQEGEDATNLVAAAGTDLTGEGQPDVVVMEYSGGAHCCSTFHIFQLGNSFRQVDSINGEHGDIQFKDLDGDGIPEIVLQDWTYAYEFTCFAGSPAPELILRYEGGHYQVAPDLMRAPRPTDEELEAEAEKVKAEYRATDENGQIHLASPSEWGAADALLWKDLLDLIYGGHEDLAVKFFDIAWPEWADGKEEALKNFAETVGKSPFWQQMVDGEENPPAPDQASLCFDP